MDAKPKHSSNLRRVSVYSSRRSSSSASKSSGNRQRADDAKQKQDDGHVKVAVRCRPMSEKELSAGYEPIIEFESEQRIVVHDVSEQPSDQLGTKSGERRNISHVYNFDQVFDWESRQHDVYDQVCRPVVDSVLEGFNGTIFAYGQTGTGKTYTMEGLRSEHFHAGSSKQDKRRHSSSSFMKGESPNDNATKASNGGISTSSNHFREQDHQHVGIIPRTFEQIFDHVARNREIQFLIRASYLEIYQEEIRDLLKKDKTNKLELHERSDIGVFVKDLTSFVCKSIGEIERVMRVGNQNRIVAATDMNEHSSRSHAIFMITIEQLKLDTKLQRESQVVGVKSRQSSVDVDDLARKDGVIRVGKLNLVDLAGSERQRKTHSFGQRQKESIKINLSLSALGNVINSLMKQQQQRQQAAPNAAATTTIHTPYRDSKLTRLLQDSLGGNAKTLMIANVGPASYNYDETINTLNYASRARCIKNRPRLNEDPKDALLRELQREIDLLRSKLANSSSKEQRTSGVSDNQSSGVSSAKSSSSGAGETTSNNSQLLVEREFIELKQKLSSLESKLLNSDKFLGLTGGETATQTQAATHPKDHTQSILKGLTGEQELELERRQAELARQANRERAIRDELERREEAELLAKQSFESIQQEIDSKRRLIWQVLLKVKSVRDEMQSTQQAYRIELDELEQLQFVLQRELKLKCLIMDNFIPNEHVDQLLPRVAYDEDRNVCYIEPLELPSYSEGCLLGGASKELKFADFWQPTLGDSLRPKSEFERISEAIYPSNIRYKYEDLIEPSLIDGQKFIPVQKAATQCNNKPRRLCDRLGDNNHAERGPLRDHAMSAGTGRLQALINEALNEREPDIVI